MTETLMTSLSYNEIILISREWIIDIDAATTAFTYFDAERIKHRLIPIRINNLWPSLHS